MQNVRKWLASIGMSEHADLFAANRIDSAVLRDLTDHDLEKLGLVLGDRRNILRAIRELGEAINHLDRRRWPSRRARTTDDAAISSTSRWTAHWALPNVTLDEPIEASHAALVNCQDDRLREVAGQHPGLERFLGAFRDECGNRVCPTIAII